MSAPKLDVPSLIALCRQLLAAVPPDLPRPAEACRRRLLDTARQLAEAYRLVQGDGSSGAKRPIDINADRAWAGIRGRLDPYTALDEERFAEAGRAKALVRKLFPSGLDFTQLEYGAQWAEASWRIDVIAEEGLEAELRRLCGDVFVDELLHWHEEYGKMVGVVPVRRGGRPAQRPRPNLAELRRQTSQAVVAWQAQLVALHLSGFAGAREGLRPTDEYREKVATGGGARDAAEPPGPPELPPTPPAPAAAAPQPG